jgi:hypothetical protein
VRPTSTAAALGSLEIWAAALTRDPPAAVSARRGAGVEKAGGGGGLGDVEEEQGLLDLLCSYGDGARWSMNGGGDLLSLFSGANHHYRMGLGLSETVVSLFLLGMESLSLSSAHTGCFVLSLKMSVLLWIV